MPPLLTLRDPLGRNTMQTAKQSSLLLLNHEFYAAGAVRTTIGNQLKKPRRYLPTTAEKQGQISALCTCVSYCLHFALPVKTLHRSNRQKNCLLSTLCCNQQVWGIRNLWGGEKSMFLFLSIPCWGMPERPFQKCSQLKVDYKFFKSSRSSTLKQSWRQQSSQTTFQMYKPSFMTQKIPAKKDCTFFWQIPEGIYYWHGGCYYMNHIKGLKYYTIPALKQWVKQRVYCELTSDPEQLSGKTLMFDFESWI